MRFKTNVVHKSKRKDNFVTGNFRKDGNTVTVMTDVGPVRVWNDTNGVYVDLKSRDFGDYCIFALTQTTDGLTASVYGDVDSAIPTYEYSYSEKEVRKMLHDFFRVHA